MHTYSKFIKINIILPWLSSIYNIRIPVPDIKITSKLLKMRFLMYVRAQFFYHLSPIY